MAAGADAVAGRAAGATSSACTRTARCLSTPRRRWTARWASPRPTSSPYLRAHHIGGFTWLLRDRLEDGQVADPEDGLFELAEVFDRCWREALTDATGDAPLADLLCRRAAARWRRGTGAENRLLAACAVRAPIYAAIVREKLSWIGVPSHALLLAHGDRRRVPAFLHAHDLFMLGLQAVDDVVDANQDRALRGGDVPTALCCSPGALVRVAPKLVRRAAAVAAEGGFSWFANWLEAFADAITTWRLDGDRARRRAGRHRHRG